MPVSLCFLRFVSIPSWAMHVAGFLDDNPLKRDLRMRGVRVWGGRAVLAEVVRRERISEILLALPGAPGTEIAAILGECRSAAVATRRIPPLAELIDNRVLVGQIREVQVEDLLGRPAVQLDESGIRAGLAGKVVLVTGAGGSIGSELCRQIARYQPAAIVGLDQSETALYHIDQEMRERFPRAVFYAEVGSVQNGRRLDEMFRGHRPHAVYHAAAYKHVPLMESHVFEAVENNIFGTHEVARAARAAGVKTVVLVSSDKAVRPVSIMGATKRMAELVCLAASEEEKRTRFLAVRFGNVLGSNGSVIPRFRRQIAAGGPVTVTHPDMRRYFMTIAEAAQLVLQAAALGTGGEVFVLDMGEPVRILDLARKMILLSGLKPDADIRIEFSGIRPGEKLCEELSAYEEDTLPTRHAQIRVFSGSGVAREVLSRCLEDLRDAVAARDAEGAVPLFARTDSGVRSEHLRSSARRRAGGLVQGVIVDRESAGGAGRSPVYDGENFCGTGVFSHYEIFGGGERSDHAEFECGGLHAEAAIGTRQKRVEFAHSVRTGCIERLAGEERRQADGPLATPFGIAGGRPVAAAFGSHKIVAGELVDGEMTGGNDGGCRRRHEGADAGLDLTRSR